MDKDTFQQEVYNVVAAIPPGQAGTVLGGTAGFAGGRGRDVQKEWVCGHEKMPVGIHERANTIRL